MLLVLSLALVLNGLVLKQKFNELINGKSQKNKKRTYYFYNNIINIEEFNSNLLKIDKKLYKDIDIGYITIKKIGDFENICSVNPLYLIIGKVDGHIKENNGSKYLVFDLAELRSTELHSTDENKEVLKKYKELWNGIRNETETINDDNIWWIW